MLQRLIYIEIFQDLILKFGFIRSWKISMYINLCNIILYWSSHIHVLPLIFQDLILKFGFILCPVLNEYFVQKNVTFDCGVEFPTIHLALLMHFHTMSIEISVFVLINRSYLINLELWDINWVQPQLLGPYLKFFSKFWLFQCK